MRGPRRRLRMRPARQPKDSRGPRGRSRFALVQSTAASRHGENSPPVPSLNSPPVAPEEDATLSKLLFGELAPLFWLRVGAVALPDPVADVWNENSSVCGGRWREVVRLGLRFGA